MERSQRISEGVRAYRLECETRGMLLAKLCNKKPHLFIQVDGFLHSVGNSFIPPDADEDGICQLLTWELMSGSDVRVLINPRTTQDEALRLLSKMRHWIERFGLPQVEEKDYPYNPIATVTVYEAAPTIFEEEKD